MPTLLTLVASEVVVMTAYGATSVDNVDIMTTHGFQLVWMRITDINSYYNVYYFNKNICFAGKITNYISDRTMIVWMKYFLPKQWTRLVQRPEYPGVPGQYHSGWCCGSLRRQGAVSIRKTVLPGMAIPMLKIRRPNGRLIFNMEITILR